MTDVTFVFCGVVYNREYIGRQANWVPSKILEEREGYRRNNWQSARSAHRPIFYKEKTMSTTNLNSRGMTVPAEIGADVPSMVSSEKRKFAGLVERVRKFDADFRPMQPDYWLSRQSERIMKEMVKLIDSNTVRKVYFVSASGGGKKITFWRNGVTRCYLRDFMRGSRIQSTVRNLSRTQNHVFGMSSYLI